MDIENVESLSTPDVQVDYHNENNTNNYGTNSCNSGFNFDIADSLRKDFQRWDIKI